MQHPELVSFIYHLYYYYLGVIGWVGMGWNHLSQDNDQWSAIVDAVMNLRVP
jgi:hypothetical protein